MAVLEAQGTTIAVAVGSPTSFSSILQVVDFNGPGGQASVIDKTNLASTAREKLMGLPDEGQLSMNLQFDPDAASHQALRTARAARTRVELRITFTDTTPSTATFFGYVLGFVVQGGVDAVVMVAVTIEIDGAVNWA